ncbi:maltokinase N-terminal cap-like domain-containing protein [Streptomyces profundus]|uniref:maltokinase N-terminal cap-like domain-containing protein n=1 Tax=Streptomyces profundus TaxID=2867410 RepID=UPI001D16F17D|nr:phosphotransferase [Streptomyces sp. MA3_2.13]UED83974.1 phosphotransferase [Streptomyces sp. MA3_2.13]
MSDSSAPRAAPAEIPQLATGQGSALLRSLTGLLANWLPEQRWFAGKGRPLGELTLISATEILPCGPAGTAPGLLHLIVRAGAGASRTSGPRAAEGDCYQLLLGVRQALPDALAPALVGRAKEGPLRGRAIYEALHDPRLAGLLLERLRTPGRLGTLSFGRAPGTTIPTGLTARVLTGEQTNSSVVFGEAHILKLFRRVSPGVNPDLELPLALAQAGCARVPAPAAWFEASWPGAVAEPLTLGVLQPFLAGSTDGWQLAQLSLETGGDFTASAHALGMATAEVHAALAAALPTERLTGRQLEQTARAMMERLNEAVDVVSALRPYRDGLRRAYVALADHAARGGAALAQRLHGDLHLGQVLTVAEAGGDAHWTVIDFEGEPARPLADRRQPGPPVRDIAGMLRSFDYAACQHRVRGNRGAAEWSRANRAAYCAGYAAARGDDPRAERELLLAYETDKAIYEVLYEARHRPSWLPVPMMAIRRLATAG